MVSSSTAELLGSANDRSVSDIRLSSGYCGYATSLLEQYTVLVGILLRTLRTLTSNDYHQTWPDCVGQEDVLPLANIAVAAAMERRVAHWMLHSRRDKCKRRAITKQVRLS